MITIPQIILLVVGAALILLGSDTGNFEDTEWYGYLGIVIFITGLLWNLIYKMLKEIFGNGD
jgi:hypothetical protein